MSEPMIDLEAGVGDDRIIGDLDVETYYCPLEILIEGDGYFRFIGDNDFTNVEIRVPFDKLKELGWSKQ